MANNLLKTIDSLHAAGIVSTAKRRRVQIHTSYWLLRDSGLNEMDAKDMVGDSYGVEIRTVSEYVYPRDKYQDLNNS